MYSKKATRGFPCGHFDHVAGKSRCTPVEEARYCSLPSGPLPDRIDLQLEVPSLPREYRMRAVRGDVCVLVRERASGARAQERHVKSNPQLGAQEIEQHGRPEAQDETWLRPVISGMGRLPRACHPILRLARTPADLAGAARVALAHAAAALQYRRFERG